MYLYIIHVQNTKCITFYIAFAIFKMALRYVLTQYANSAFLFMASSLFMYLIVEIDV